ncbi:MAG: CPBP family glutamic-type intramembrane protease [Polyangiaceae bacterium]
MRGDERDGGALSVLWIGLVVAAVAGATAYALRQDVAGTWAMWLGLCVPYGALGVLAVLRLRAAGVLRERLRLRGGDPTLGILAGVVLLAGAWLVCNVLAPHGSPRRAWLFQVFIVSGSAQETTFTLLLVLLVFLEELVWRGLVLHELEQRLSRRAAPAAAAALYALAHLPSMFTLADPVAGINPLLVVAAFALGLPCGYLVQRRGTLVAAFFCHGVFSYFGATSFKYFM